MIFASSASGTVVVAQPVRQIKAASVKRILLFFIKKVRTIKDDCPDQIPLSLFCYDNFMSRCKVDDNDNKNDDNKNRNNNAKATILTNP